VVVVAAFAWGPVQRHVKAARLLARFEDPGAAVAGVETRETTLAGLRARRYATADGGPPLLLLHGVHPEGIDEPRLVRFARLLADAGFTVVTPELPALTEFRFDPASVDRVGASARALAAREGVDAVGALGISFGGGLALAAAADPAHRDAFAAIWAVGPHHDARRLARWWRGEPLEGPAGARPSVTPGRYGTQVFAYAYAEDYFDEAPAKGERALRALLDHDLERMRALAAELPPSARAKLEALRHGRDLAPVASRLEAIAEAHADELAALSPAGRLDRIRAPVYLLHGRDDPVIASTESLWIAEELPRSCLGGLVRTGLLGHADHRRIELAQKWSVVHLVAGALDALGG
jgi:pimeloyl-ACP methyl ester carboxylesterase